MRNLIILIVTAATIAACGDQGPEIPTFTGHWEGFVDAEFTVLISASEREGAVTGAGRFVGSPQQGTVAFSVSGVHLHPDVALTLRPSGFADVNFSGTFDGVDRVSGRLDGAGFTDDSLTLTRQ